MLSIVFIYFNYYHDSKTLGFIYFVDLKNTPKVIGLCGPMLSSGLNSPKQIRAKQSHSSKDTWLRTKTALDTHHSHEPPNLNVDVFT